MIHRLRGVLRENLGFIRRAVQHKILIWLIFCIFVPHNKCLFFPENFGMKLLERRDTVTSTFTHNHSQLLHLATKTANFLELGVIWHAEHDSEVKTYPCPYTSTPHLVPPTPSPSSAPQPENLHSSFCRAQKVT